MARRRSLLAVCGTVSLGLTGGCVEELAGDGQVSDTDKRREILELYDRGIGDYNEATETRDLGIRLFNDEQHEQARNEFQSALNEYQKAEQQFVGASTHAEELGADEASELIDRAIQRVALEQKGTEMGIDLAEAAIQGEGASEINARIEEFREVVEEAQEYPFVEAEELSEALGFETR